MLILVFIQGQRQKNKRTHYFYQLWPGPAPAYFIGLPVSCVLLLTDLFFLQQHRCDRDREIVKWNYVYTYIYTYIPPALWASGGIDVAWMKITPSPYTLPGPPIRWAWTTRERTLLTFEAINTTSPTVKP